MLPVVIGETIQNIESQVAGIAEELKSSSNMVVLAKGLSLSIALYFEFYKLEKEH